MVLDVSHWHIEDANLEYSEVTSFQWTRIGFGWGGVDFIYQRVLQVSKAISSVTLADDERPTKKAKLGEDHSRQWKAFADSAAAAKRAVEASDSGFAFQFVEGLLMKALRSGQWILLDEINLAPPQACILSLHKGAIFLHPMSSTSIVTSVVPDL